MAEISGLVDLKKVCNGLVYKMSLDPYYQTKFYQYGLDGITQLKLYTLGETKVEKLTVNQDLNTVAFPDDYMKFIDVGVPIGGRLWSLTKDNTLIDTTTIVNGQETYDSEIGEGDYTLYKQNGAGGQNIRYYHLDEKERRMVITGLDIETVWLVYISTGVYTDEPTYIPRAVKPAIEAYIRFEFFNDGTASPANKLMFYESQLKKQKAKLKRLKYPTLQQMADSLAKTFYRISK